MKIDRQLLEKYNVPVPRYTSYPPANFFLSAFDHDKAIDTVRQSNDLEPENLSFYLHIPFCSQLCYYCGCFTHITKNKDLMDKYVEFLKKEILLYKDLLDPQRKISQIHWGGGTPNYLPLSHIEQIMNLIYDNFRLTDDPEIAMELHPTHITPEYLEGLRNLGFNRISIGIQDFSHDVLNKVNRALPAMPVEQIVDLAKKLGFPVNLDFIYGLPGQNVESFARTMEKAVELDPGRFAIFSYAHVPWVKPHQKLLEKYIIPDAETKIQMFEAAYEILTGAGYVSIGLDHFAKPDDELTLALNERKLCRNFQGYCTRRTTGQVYAFGVSGISQLSNAYLQNTKDLQRYFNDLENGRLPYEKAYFLNRDEKIIGSLISEIMCNRYVDLENFAAQHGLTLEQLKSLTGTDEDKLSTFDDEGLILYDGKTLEVTQQGMFFLRNIASAFDPLQKNTDKKFSKSL